MKAIRWLLKLVLVMITLPLLLAVWLAKWFVVFLHHCSAWFFYLLGSVLLATAVLSYLLQQSQGMEAFQMMIGGFVIDNICTFCAKALFLELCVYYKTLVGKLHPRTC